MARFTRLTWADLNTHTRDELLARLEAEQQYWARREKRGLSEADQQARKQFTAIVFAVLNPDWLASSLAETAAWLKGEQPADSSFWCETPGADQDLVATRDQEHG